MRGGLQRWKRGTDSHGVRAAIAYALEGRCDAHIRIASGTGALADYSDAATRSVTRFIVESGVISTDQLDRTQLEAWVDGRDPVTGERRGRELISERADLVLDGTINAPKSHSLVAMIHPKLAAEFEALQDRLRDRVLRTWEHELNARRGAGGRVREGLARVEVVELQHRRSRALDPHVHRHLWLNVKVLGKDGAWSNVDSRVAMRLHTVINAEGELAARTDPTWIAALARHGYTLDADGEVAQVVHAVKPLSRRAVQIEANRAMLIASWQDAHSGTQPDHDVLRQIDRQAWATGRPRKPTGLDEQAWEQLVRDELRGLDPSLLRPRALVAPHRAAIASLDLALLAARAVVEADARSASCGGRFSVMDIRAGAIRALAATGLIEDRDVLQSVIDELTWRGRELSVDLLPGEGTCPEHVKALMAAATAQLKVNLAAAFDRLNIDGCRADLDAVFQVAALILARDTDLDAGQVEAAAAISGTDRLVTVTGPAGAGKTTMLRVAHRLLADQGRRLLVVAPTKKAGSVAGREIGTTASSLHALLADHGWRWDRDDAGAEQWTRLAPGSTDPNTGRPYAGPARFPMAAGDRVVVDEAGMVDLHTATALAALAEETGAGIAMVGDHLQAMPVGHSGAMATMARRSGSVVELNTVHRFRDPHYATLTLRLREPATHDDALSVAADLGARGHIHRVTDAGQARDVMVEAFFRWSAEHKRVALVTGTNDEADAVNEAIQQRRVDLGQLYTRRLAIGQGEQRLLEGDIVQTRRNDSGTGVENRALWTIRAIHADRLELTSITDSADIRTVTRDYAAEHVHLAYASTVHGIQGETTDASVVGAGVDASGLYVGMTRGRIFNEAIAIARTDADARAQIADSMMRGHPEVTIDDGIRAAATELHRAARPPGEPTNVDDEPARADLARATENLRTAEEWIASTSDLLRRIEVDETTTDANTRGRGHTPPPVQLSDDVRELQEMLRARVDALPALREAAKNLTTASAVSASQPRDVPLPVRRPRTPDVFTGDWLVPGSASRNRR